MLCCVVLWRTILENNYIYWQFLFGKGKKIVSNITQDASNLKKQRHFVTFELQNNIISKALSPKA